jgi:hypothetical protein
MNDKWQEIQQADEEKRMSNLLEALQKVDRAGLKNEALYLAFEYGETIYKQFLHWLLTEQEKLHA